MEKKCKLSSEEEHESSDYDSSESTILLDLFNEIMDMEGQMSEGGPNHKEDGCERNKTSCDKTLRAVRKLVLGKEKKDPEYERIEIQFDRHRVPKDDKLHFRQYPEIIDDITMTPVAKKLFIRSGAYPFQGTIDDSTLVNAMVQLARVLHHNYIRLEYFEFTSFAIHGTYSEHRENACVSIKGKRIK
ncbi:MAG: hypothetical protein ACTSUE_06340 [Promethearchaeota archaeon]